MRVVQKKVYYCDFCGKHFLRPMTKHEKYCTGNPDRGCRMCGMPINIREMAKVVVLNHGDALGTREIPMDVLYGITECPACILALIREIRKIHPDGQRLCESPGFVYTDAVRIWWEERAKEEMEEP